jgi:hypothetical protein
MLGIFCKDGLVNLRGQVAATLKVMLDGASKVDLHDRHLTDHS